MLIFHLLQGVPLSSIDKLLVFLCCILGLTVAIGSIHTINELEKKHFLKKALSASAIGIGALSLLATFFWLTKPYLRDGGWRAFLCLAELWLADGGPIFRLLYLVVVSVMGFWLLQIRGGLLRKLLLPLITLGVTFSVPYFVSIIPNLDYNLVFFDENVTCLAQLMCLAVWGLRNPRVLNWIGGGAAQRGMTIPTFLVKRRPNGLCCREINGPTT